MSADKHPADMLADDIAGRHAVTTDAIEFWLRRIPALEAERDKAQKALALVQQHHATAWHRGHAAGLRAASDTVKQANAAVAADAWGNAQLTEALMAAEAERDQLRAEVEALREANSTFATAAILPDDKVIVDKAEVEAPRADAERYRWLRSDTQTVAGPCAYGSWMGLPMFTDELDSAIDAARKQQ